jgi:outer membrane protein assembly factor BamB
MCLRLSTQGKARAEVAWTASTKGAEIPSPLVLGDYYYYAEDKGFVSCLRADTGERVWRRRLNGMVQASPVATGDRLYFAGLSGTVTVLRGGPHFQVLARNELDEGLVASPALANSCLFLRGEKHLYCISGEPK